MTSNLARMRFARGVYFHWAVLSVIFSWPMTRKRALVSTSKFVLTNFYAVTKLKVDMGLGTKSNVAVKWAT